ncbi:hypothetical protein DEU56DRAFT_778777 [Suillus clintonianus]|uniref:uncharacterized protein n=1 Tax=Suillus clintonianus TaxID=1904413 RepID=UPI001B8613E3|nr:uncharacterized protein DEU56DRAFT_778777 [Suillus clintonianus]KAG2150845.1 hypothetical protein DEU56DRAFT_778777 [Suillus clintonianus]
MQNAPSVMHDAAHTEIGCSMESNSGVDRPETHSNQSQDTDRPGAHGILSIPSELIHHILKYLGNADLVNAATVCPSFRCISQRVIYRNVEPTGDMIIPCLKCFASYPHLASCARTLILFDATRHYDVFSNYFNLLRRALLNASSLTDLTLLLDGPYARYLHGCSFRLRSLTTTLDWDRDFVKLISEQTELCNAMFGGRFANDTVLPSDTLKKLTRVSASPLILAAVVPNRKVKEVELCLLQQELFKHDILHTALNILSYSTGPLTALQIITHISDTPDALAALNTIPRNLPRLNSFAFYSSGGAVSQELLEALPDFLSGFECLRSLTLMSRDKADALHDKTFTATLASRWHKSCPSLQSVSLAGSIWLYNTRYGWVTLLDFERLLRERQGLLLSRQKYWLEADPGTISLEDLKNNLEEDKDEAEQGNQMERQMSVLRDSILQFGGP